MKNRSLTLCASILLLTPFAMASRMPTDFQFSLALGNRSVTIGDRTGTATNLLGDRKTTSSVTAAGTTIALAHSTPALIVEGSTMVPMGSNKFGIKLGFEAHLSNSDTHKLYDGQSKTATITLDSYSAVLDSDLSGAVGTGYQKAVFGVIGVTGGKRVATVDHQAVYGLKALYTFGEDNAAGLGVSILWSQDEYKYFVEENPAEAASSGVFNQSSPTYANLFQLEAPTAVSSPALHANNRAGTATTAGHTYTPTTGTTEKYDDKRAWIGVVAEGSGEINDHLSFKGGLGWYTTSFEVSKSPTTQAPFIVTASDGTMYVGHVGVGFKTSRS